MKVPPVLPTLTTALAAITAVMPQPDVQAPALDAPLGPNKLAKKDSLTAMRAELPDCPTSGTAKIVAGSFFLPLFGAGLGALSGKCLDPFVNLDHSEEKSMMWKGAAAGAAVGALVGIALDVEGAKEVKLYVEEVDCVRSFRNSQD